MGGGKKTKGVPKVMTVGRHTKAVCLLNLQCVSVNIFTVTGNVSNALTRSYNLHSGKGMYWKNNKC